MGVNKDSIIMQEKQYREAKLIINNPNQEIKVITIINNKYNNNNIIFDITPMR